MKIAPIDISHKAFSKKLMGFDSNEVTDFLRLVAEEMELIIRERNQLKESLREKELAILEYKDRDKVLKDTITTAQKMSERIREEAEKERQLVLADGQQKGEAIVREARDSLKRVYREISELQRIKTQFEVNLKTMVQSHLAVLEQSDRFFPKGSVSELEFEKA